MHKVVPLPTLKSVRFAVRFATDCRGSEVKFLSTEEEGKLGARVPDRAFYDGSELDVMTLDELVRMGSGAGHKRAYECGISSEEDEEMTGQVPVHSESAPAAKRLCIRPGHDDTTGLMVDKEAFTWSCVETGVWVKDLKHESSAARTDPRNLNTLFGAREQSVSVRDFNRPGFMETLPRYSLGPSDEAQEASNAHFLAAHREWVQSLSSLAIPDVSQYLAGEAHRYILAVAGCIDALEGLNADWDNIDKQGLSTAVLLSTSRAKADSLASKKSELWGMIEDAIEGWELNDSASSDHSSASDSRSAIADFKAELSSLRQPQSVNNPWAEFHRTVFVQLMGFERAVSVIDGLRKAIDEPVTPWALSSMQEQLEECRAFAMQLGGVSNPMIQTNNYMHLLSELAIIEAHIGTELQAHRDLDKHLQEVYLQLSFETYASFRLQQDIIRRYKELGMLSEAAISDIDRLSGTMADLFESLRIVILEAKRMLSEYTADIAYYRRIKSTPYGYNFKRRTLGNYTRILEGKWIKNMALGDLLSRKNSIPVHIFSLAELSRDVQNPKSRRWAVFHPENEQAAYYQLRLNVRSTVLGFLREVDATLNAASGFYDRMHDSKSNWDRVKKEISWREDSDSDASVATDEVPDDDSDGGSTVYDVNGDGSSLESVFNDDDR